MGRIAAEGPNAQQIEYWNDVSGARWVEMSDVIDAQIASLGEAAMTRAAIATGERVLDVAVVVARRVFSWRNASGTRVL
jgi:hypothetical protein